jgi:hypothetical protein
MQIKLDYPSSSGEDAIQQKKCNAYECEVLQLYDQIHLEEDELSVHRKHYMNTKECFHTVCGDNHMSIVVICRS